MRAETASRGRQSQQYDRRRSRSALDTTVMLEAGMARAPNSGRSMGPNEGHSEHIGWVAPHQHDVTGLHCDIRPGANRDAQLSLRQRRGVVHAVAPPWR
jgi:hypothetical protein